MTAGSKQHDKNISPRPTAGLFYISAYDKAQPEIVLEEEVSRHVVQVLRMRAGQDLQLTDGRGNLLKAVIVDDQKKRCVVKWENAVFTPQPEKKVSLAISLLKNASRFEWFLEKATEIGVTEIIPLLCERTEKQHFRNDRMQHILVSAMLQSQQAWLPVLQLPTPADQVITGSYHTRKYIAHCLEGNRLPLAEAVKAGDAVNGSSLILIGPEGDFSSKEIELALRESFVAVTLGETRLRSETAGVAAAVLLSI
jgi:16S rRNA (uracil1498-N3)-methyltransferase